MIQLSCIGRAEPSDLQSILPAVTEAAQAVDLDHARLAAVLDWVQYRRNFRAPVMVRPFGGALGLIPTAPDAFAHSCNLYDNLPTDELMRVGDRASEPLVRASITPAEIDDLSRIHGVSKDDLVATVQQALRHGPESLGDVAPGVSLPDRWRGAQNLKRD